MDILMEVPRYSGRGFHSVFCIIFVSSLILPGLCVFVEQPGPVYGLLGEQLDIPCVINKDSTFAFWKQDKDDLGVWENGGFVGDYGSKYEIVGTSDRDITLRIKSVELNEEQLRCEFIIPGNDPVQPRSSPSEITVIAPPYDDYPKCELSSGTIIAGEELTLICNSAGGVPAATLQWRDGSTVIDSGPGIEGAPDGNGRGNRRLEHTFRVNKSDNGKTLMNRAENTAITELYNSGDFDQPYKECETTLNVLYLPEVTVGPAKPTYIVIEDQPATLTCTVDDANPDDITEYIFKAGSQSWQTSTTGSKVVYNKTPRGPHTGRCKATNAAGTGVEDTLTIVVHYKPEITITPSEDDGVDSKTELREGENLDVSCVADALPEPNSIRWTMDNAASAPGSGGNLQIDSISRDDAGTYTCTAINQMTPTDSSPVEGRESRDLNVVVMYVPDDAETDHEKRTVKAGDDITLTCTSPDFGVPQGYFEWKRDDTPIGGSTDDKEGRYKITDARVDDDDGLYQCTPTNNIGSGAAANITLEVQEEPREQGEMQSTTVLNTRDFSMSCKFKARPEATIVWEYSNDTQLPDNIFSDVTETDVDGKYTVTTSTLRWNADSDPNDRRHSGGNIRCVAENVVETAESSAALNVDYIPYTVKTIPDTKKKGTAKGAAVELTLEVLASPLTRAEDFTWWTVINSSSDEISGDAGNFHILNTDTSSTLTILNITEDHFGQYQVRVFNTHGDLLDSDDSVGVTFEVTPNSAPEKPRNLQLTATAVSLTLDWDRGFDGGKPQTFYLSVNDIHQPTIPDDQDDSGHYTVRLDDDEDDIAESTTYTVSLYAKNDIGESDTVTKTVTTKAKPSVNTKETNIAVDKDNNVAIITWSVNNPESFTHIVVKVCEVDSNVCLEHEITDVLSTSTVDIPEGDDYDFSFYIHDGDELVTKQEGAMTSGSDGGGGGGLNMGIVGGVVGVIIVLVVVIVILVILIRRKRAQKGTDPERNDKGPLAKKKKKQRADTSFDNHGMAMTDIDPYATATSNDRNGVSAPPNGAGAEPAYADVEVKNKKKSKMPLYSLPNIAKKKKVPTATLR